MIKSIQSRQEQRVKCARMLNALSPDVLYTRFGISRVSQINGFDWVGLPVFSVTRPEGLSVSINSGKGLSPMMARAGAVAACSISVATAAGRDT